MVVLVLVVGTVSCRSSSGLEAGTLLLGDARLNIAPTTLLADRHAIIINIIKWQSGLRNNNNLFLGTRDNMTEQRAGLFSARVSSSRLWRILGLSGVDNVRNIAGITIHGVGDLT